MPLPLQTFDPLHTTAHSDSLPWYQVRRARIVLALAAGQRKRDVAAQLESFVATVWRTCERYRQDGSKSCWPMGVKVVRDGWSRSHQCNGRRSFQFGLFGTDCQGLAHHPLVQSGPGSSSRGGQIVGWINPATVRRLLHDVDLQPHRTRSGRQPAWTPGSKSERSKSFGAMGMRSDWRNKASGSFVSMRSRPSRFWSVNPFAGRSPARLSNRSSTILGMGP